MIALDTNVLVRFLVDDDKVQSARAARLIRRAIARDEALFVSDVVVCETVWVWSSAYRVPRAEIGDALGQLLGATHVVFREAEVLLRAREAYVRGRGDFAGYVIREGARAAGCDQVATFDRSLLREQGFVAP